jgi:hypothetical protein
MLVVAGFSLAVYFWAMRVALPAEKIEQTISESVVEEPPELRAAA